MNKGFTLFISVGKEFLVEMDSNTCHDTVPNLYLKNRFRYYTTKGQGGLRLKHMRDVDIVLLACHSGCFYCNETIFGLRCQTCRYPGLQEVDLGKMEGNFILLAQLSSRPQISLQTFILGCWIDHQIEDGKFVDLDPSNIPLDMLKHTISQYNSLGRNWIDLASPFSLYFGKDLISYFVKF